MFHSHVISGARKPVSVLRLVQNVEHGVWDRAQFEDLLQPHVLACSNVLP